MPESLTSLDKALSLMTLVLERRGHVTLSALAAESRLTVSTAHRLLRGLERSGFIARLGRSAYVGGPTMRRLARMQASTSELLTDVGRPVLAELSRKTHRTTHLGILEDGMLRYLVKEGDPEGKTLSRPDVQLEAYCTAIGKALLAHLPEGEREAYLSTGPFVELTSNTITSTKALRQEFVRTRERGYALDVEEMFEGFVCVAIPIHVGGIVVAAISLVATQSAEPCRPTDYLARLRVAASRIENGLIDVGDLFHQG